MQKEADVLPPCHLPLRERLVKAICLFFKHVLVVPGDYDGFAGFRVDVIITAEPVRQQGQHAPFSLHRSKQRTIPILPPAFRQGDAALHDPGGLRDGIDLRNDVLVFRRILRHFQLKVLQDQLNLADRLLRGSLRLIVTIRPAHDPVAQAAEIPLHHFPYRCGKGLKLFSK